MMPDLAVWSATFLLLAAVALFVAAPLADGLRRAQREGEAPNREQLRRQQGLATAALRELDFDRALGKVDAADYAALHAALEARALTAMRALEPSAARANQQGRCCACGAALRSGANYCIACGAALGPAKNDAAES